MEELTLTQRIVAFVIGETLGRAREALERATVYLDGHGRPDPCACSARRAELEQRRRIEAMWWPRYEHLAALRITVGDLVDAGWDRDQAVQFWNFSFNDTTPSVLFEQFRVLIYQERIRGFMEFVLQRTEAARNGSLS